MPDESTQTAPESADPFAPLDGEPASIAGAGAGGDLDLAEARRILGAVDVPINGRERNALSDEEPDPLRNDFDEDPLGAEVAAHEESPLAEEPEPETPAGEVPPVEEPETPEVDPDPEAEPKAEKDGRRRININRKNADGTFVLSDRERAILRAVDEDAISYTEAEKRLFGGPEAPAAKKDEQAQEIKLEPVLGAKEIGAKIDAKYKELEEAGDAMETGRMAKLQREIRGLEAEERSAEAREAAQAQARETAAQAAARVEGECMDLASRQYPALVKAGATRSEYEQYLSRLKAENDPVLASPRWAILTARDFAAEKGITPTPLSTAQPAEAARTAKPATPAVVKPAVTPRRATPVPSPGGVSGGAPSPAKSLSDQIDAARARNDQPALRSLLAQAEQQGKDTRLRRAA